jgi:hypothetical protein
MRTGVVQVISETTVRLLGVVIVGTTIAAGCAGGDRTTSPPADPPGTAAPSAATPTPPLSLAENARREALAAFDAMWQDMALASEKADYQSPVLARHAAGEALDLLTRGVYSFRLEDQVTRGRPVVTGRVTTLTPPDKPTTASIDGCVDSSQWVEYDAKTLKPSGEPPGGRHRTTATVTVINGVWKVTKYHGEATGTC